MLMCDTYRVAFVGHRDFDGHRILDRFLPPIIRDLIIENHFVEMYIGRNGEFDVYAASLIKRVQNELGKADNEFICVLPYVGKDIQYYENYYDSVIIPECLAGAYPKSAITKRNRWMIDNSEYVVSYIRKDHGGAFTAVSYAVRHDKTIIPV